MAIGVPVIATNTGGLPELVENGVSGHLCEVSDIDKMASCFRNTILTINQLANTGPLP